MISIRRSKAIGPTESKQIRIDEFHAVAIQQWQFFRMRSRHSDKALPTGEWEERDQRNPLDRQGVFFIASGDRIFYTDSPEEGQIWSMGIDGSGAARLSEDKVAAFNVSGDWIYYSHPKDEMMSIEFKKMKRDGSEASRVNEDRPVVINVHEDLLGYLQFDLATFSMSEVFVRTDGSGRKEFIMTPENSMPERPEDDPVNEGEETFMKNEKVSGHGMTVTVDRVFTTNLNPSDAHQKERFFGGANRIDKFLYITFTVTNDGEEPLNMNDRVVIQGKNTEDGGEYILWLNLADVTDRMEEVREKEHLACRQ